MSSLEAWAAGESAHLIEALERDLLLTLLNPLVGERILVLGCGRGRRLQLLKNRGFQVVGLEEDKALAGATGERLGNRYLVSHARLDDLPFDDNSFDLVLVSPSLGCAAHPETVLAEAGRVAARRLVIEVINPCSLLGLKFRWGRKMGISQWFGPWRLKSLIRQILGDCPITVRSILTFPQGWLTWLKKVESSPRIQKSYLGGLLFVAVDIRYTLITDPLTAPTKPIHLAAPSGPVRMEDSATRLESQEHESSLPV